MGQIPSISGSSIISMQRQKVATIIAALLLPMLLAAILAASVQAADLPEGEGKDLVLKVCTPCHGIAEFAERRNTKEEWNEVVDKMAGRGAKASDEEFDAIVNYLTKYLGKGQSAEKAN